MSEEGQDILTREFIEQVYINYLDSLYEVDYYREYRLSVVWYSQYLDFFIGLGAAISGGAGVVGVFDGNIYFGYACGSVAVLSVILSAAKQAFDWPAKINFASERMQLFAVISAKYKILVDRIQIARSVSLDSFQRHDNYSKNCWHFHLIHTSPFLSIKWKVFKAKSRSSRIQKAGGNPSPAILPD